jgi:hypothetical protein
MVLEAIIRMANFLAVTLTLLLDLLLQSSSAAATIQIHLFTRDQLFIRLAEPLVTWFWHQIDKQRPVLCAHLPLQLMLLPFMLLYV